MKTRDLPIPRPLAAPGSRVPAALGLGSAPAHPQATHADFNPVDGGGTRRGPVHH